MFGRSGSRHERMAGRVERRVPRGQLSWEMTSAECGRSGTAMLCGSLSDGWSSAGPLPGPPPP